MARKLGTPAATPIGRNTVGAKRVRTQTGMLGRDASSRNGDFNTAPILKQRDRKRDRWGRFA